MSIRVLLGLVLCCSSFFTLAAGEAEAEAVTEAATEAAAEAISEDDEYIAWATAIWEALDKQTGVITLDGTSASLNVPDDFYYLNPADSERVLSEVWGNPPGSTVLGMLFPADMTPFDRDSWAVTVDYQEDGFVSDENANEIDYDEMLAEMKKDTKVSSDARVAEGYETIELLGWAASPFYDAEAKKLHWAKELRFGTQEMTTLNYDIRVLGRKGVLVLSFIANIDQKAEIEENVDTVLALAEFDEGSTYSDFDPDLDQVAAYGIGALVAGKVIAKTGLIAVVLVFLKKFGIFILLGLGILFKNLISRKKDKA